MKKSIILVIGTVFIALILLPIYSQASVDKDIKTKINDDLYVEVKAQIFFATQQVYKKYQGTRAVKKALEAEKTIYKKYGVTKDELDKYLEELAEKDVNRAGRLMMKIMLRAEELKAGEKKEPESQVEKGEVKGFIGIPAYPGAGLISGSSEAGDTKWAEETLKKKGYIWYEFEKKLADEYWEDARGVDNRIIDYYKGELAKTGWKYIGKGLDTNHWIKGQKAVGIYFPADCTIEYKHMNVEEAKGNCGQLSKDKFVEVFMKCVKATQDSCEKQGIKNMDDYQSKMVDEDTFKSIKEEFEKSLNKALKPYGVNFKRFKEIIKKGNFDEMMGRLYSEHEKEINVLQLGFYILSGLMR